MRSLVHSFICLATLRGYLVAAALRVLLAATACSVPNDTEGTQRLGGRRASRRRCWCVWLGVNSAVSEARVLDFSNILSLTAES